MKYLLLFVAVLMQLGALSSAKRKNKKDYSMLRFSDCGKDPKRPIRIEYVKIKPMPVIIPGTLFLSMAGNVTDDLPPNISLHASVKKYFYGIAFLLPCYKNQLGSCVYDDVCGILEQYHINGCPQGLSGKHIRCRCPFLASPFRIDNVPIHIPNFGGFIGSMVNGRYHLQMRLLSDKKELGCLQMNFSIRKKNKGWFFKI